MVSGAPKSAHGPFPTNEMRRSDGAFVSIGVFAIVFAIEAAAKSPAVDCSCGYYDAAARVLWTESIITYFNETTTLPIPSFIAESYSHKIEKGWNTQFRTGADVSNIRFTNHTSAPSSLQSLELEVSPYRSDHLVVGSSLRTSRRDIQYGSFHFLLRSPGKSAGGGGSVLSAAVEYNSSQSISTNLQNTDMPSTASITTLAGEEPPDTSLISYKSINNGSFGNNTLSLWDYTEHRLEWTPAGVNFIIGNSLARSISRDEKESLLSIPAHLYLRHWSNGLATGSQGPPTRPSVANVGWVRMFFNSSLMTDDDHAKFDDRCRTSVACLVTDMTLRGSSIYSEESEKEWKQAPGNTPRRVTTIWLAVSCISLTACLLVRPIWIRVHERLFPARELEMTLEARRESVHTSSPNLQSTAGLGIDVIPPSKTVDSSIDTATLVETNQSTPSAASFKRSRPSSTSPKRESGQTFRRRSTYPRDGLSSEDESHAEGQKDPNQKPLRELLAPEVISAKPRNRISTIDNIQLSELGTGGQEKQESKSSPSDKEATSRDWRVSWHNIGWGDTKKSTQPMPWSKSPIAPETEALDSPTKKTTFNKNLTEAILSLPEDRHRINHLAGLVVVSCVIVTAINFNLTFVYGDLMPDRFIHYHSEEVARKTIVSFLLNPIWIGPFLLTSARFLITSYLHTGNLLAVAERLVKRIFRLMLPLTAMVMFEYFFIDCSATKWLEYLPSITWSTWPFIRGYSNFGNFMSEVLELVYLIPNTSPVISFNFCTNVLWSIPVQLQGSWTTLLAAIVIREIKAPWKRFCFYAFCIVNHWYALSWGSYFYFGILLTDLDLTYQWQPYLRGRPLFYYAVLLLAVCSAIAGPSLDLLTQRTEIDYAAYEYGIHPNLTSGLPISESGQVTSPMYFFPRLNGLVFTVGLQAAVELSPFIQKLFSPKLLMLIFPHIYTIYLFHGFIFWTFGSWLCAFLAIRGLSYWTNILVVALCSYAVLALSAPLVTPVLDSLGKSVTMDVWREAHEEPAPRHPTLYPFPRGLLLDREEVSWERKPSKDIIADQQEHRVSRLISRVRQPSKDLRSSWYDQGPSVEMNADSAERRASRMIPPDRNPSRALRTSLYEQGPAPDEITDPAERRVFRIFPRDRNPSNAVRASWYEQGPTPDEGMNPLEGRVSRAIPRDRKPSKDLRGSWYEQTPPPDESMDPMERRASRTRPRDLRRSWLDRKSSADPRASWREGEPSDRGKASPDLRRSMYDRKSPVDPRTPLRESEPSDQGKTSPNLRRPLFDRKDSVDPRRCGYEGEPSNRTSWPLSGSSSEDSSSMHGGSTPPGNRSSWHERKASKTGRLDHVEEEEED